MISSFGGMLSSNTSDYMILFRCGFRGSSSSEVPVCKEIDTDEWKINRRSRDHSDGNLSYTLSCGDVKASLSLLFLHLQQASQQLCNLVTDLQLLTPAGS